MVHSQQVASYGLADDLGIHNWTTEELQVADSVLTQPQTELKQYNSATLAGLVYMGEGTLADKTK